MDFEKLYASLNPAQKQAVDMVDGPLLVIAGPGTGKTQLLSARAANIVRLGSVAPNNILCLTYTEAGAAEMRSRLIRLMGPNGSEVAVHTFHSFGSWIINQYPQYFTTERSLKLLDELGRFQVFESLLSGLPLRHQFAVRDEAKRFVRAHSVEEAIGAFKQAGLEPEEVRSLLKNNQHEYIRLEPLLAELFGTTLHAKRLPSIAAAVDDYAATHDIGAHSYSHIVLASLRNAIDASAEVGKTAALGAWRTKYTTIDNGKRVLKSAAGNQLVLDTIQLYEAYNQTLHSLGYYDYVDMILWASKALENHADLRFDVAERFQYIMVDEYQDTNGAQNKLLDSLLQANPIDSPNVMAVGDDDQAIMRFQGAESSGMLAFVEQYEPEIIVLKDNYRSGQPILDASRQVMVQTDERLEVSIPEYGFTKELSAQTAPKTSIQHLRYASPAAEYYAVAEHIADLCRQGVEPSQIGVIARKHAELTEFVPHVLARGISVAYDRREDVLEHQSVRELCELARYIARLCEQPGRADELLPTVLSAEYWRLPALSLYSLAAKARNAKTSWLDTMLAEEPDSPWPTIAEWLVAAAETCHTSNFTQMLDIVIGRAPLDGTTLRFSPFKSTYENQPPAVYTMILSHLICVREAVLAHNPSARGLSDFLRVIDLYRQSGVRLMDNNPLLRGDSESVQLMSAHGSKGREFEHVIILSTVDEVWGNRARANNQRIRMPENLSIYPAGDNESDRLRLLYVAMTRARSHLLLASYAQTDAGKASTPLGFFALGEQENGWWQPQDIKLETEATQQALETRWRPTATDARSLKQTLQPVLERFRMSASALNDFLNLRYGGPLSCIESHVLRFPSSYNDRSALGSAVHKVLQTAHAAYIKGAPLNRDNLISHFNEYLDESGLEPAELAAVRSHGEQFIPAFVDQFAVTDFAAITHTEQFLQADTPEFKVPISGAVDAIAEGPLRVIDYKSGIPPKPDWQRKGLSEGKNISLHFYRLQLLFYKLLVENSQAYGKSSRVECAELVFVEPNDQGQFIRLAIDSFDSAELTRAELLVKSVYDRIMRAELPDTSGYTADLKGIEQFENDLISGAI